eukprot:CAMPEP_0183761062 /NCGR_PEP_ID=MMETSP0739-20130205/8184_1 /TAXON_ID=385413 /ORGANISM="Thalassiosira miniscula, Strain CCMP1093" /LENGTH=71 /DNA_ID=CAMNT_0025999137 /DNA_START=627 /DNA_END=838 /DNA_ORIENTATION=-
MTEGCLKQRPYLSNFLGSFEDAGSMSVAISLGLSLKTVLSLNLSGRVNLFLVLGELLRRPFPFLSFCGDVA